MLLTRATFRGECIQWVYLQIHVIHLNDDLDVYFDCIISRFLTVREYYGQDAIIRGSPRYQLRWNNDSIQLYFAHAEEV